MHMTYVDECMQKFGNLWLLLTDIVLIIENEKSMHNSMLTGKYAIYDDS